MFMFLAIALNALVLAVAVYGFRASKKAVETYNTTHRARENVRADAANMRTT